MWKNWKYDKMSNPLDSDTTNFHFFIVFLISEIFYNEYAPLFFFKNELNFHMLLQEVST